MTKHFLIFGWIVGTVIGGSGIPALAATRANPPPGACISDREDPFAPDARLGGDSQYAGECLDTALNRSIKKVDPELLKPYTTAIRPYTRVVANFRHLDQYWLAEIPLYGIKQVIMQREFDKRGFAIHHQPRFLMEDFAPIRLYPQKPSQRATFTKPLEIRDFVVSMVGLRPQSLKGTPFSPVKGFKDAYGTAMGFLSMDDVGPNETFSIGHDLEQYVLKLGDEQMAGLLDYYVDRSDEIQYTLIYNTASSNCIGEVFNGLFKVQKLQEPWFFLWYRNFTASEYNPFVVKTTLWKLRLIEWGEGSRILYYSEEYKLKHPWNPEWPVVPH